MISDRTKRPSIQLSVTSFHTADLLPFAVPQELSVTMEAIRRKSSSQSASRNGRWSGNANVDTLKCKETDSKGRWFSQIKDWVTTTEPSNQALKDYKKDAFRRAGTTPKDPRATAKLHIPTTTLPPEAIRPSGPGPDPEEIVMRKAAQRRKLRQSFGTAGSISGGSRSSASQHSSLSSLPLQDVKEDD